MEVFGIVNNHADQNMQHPKYSKFQSVSLENIQKWNVTKKYHFGWI
jgi:hypothetical protein